MWIVRRRPSRNLPNLCRSGDDGFVFFFFSRSLADHHDDELAFSPPLQVPSEQPSAVLSSIRTQEDDRCRLHIQG
jgi:hypothetical protein